MHPASDRGVRWHPLVVAALWMPGARILALILHFESNDPNGNAMSASPFNALLVAVPYHGSFLLPTAALLLMAWMLLPRMRPAVTAAGIAVAVGSITLGQVDLAMQWFVGLRFVPMVADTYLTGSVLSSDLYAPLFFHPLYFATALALIVVPLAFIMRAVAWRRRAARMRLPSWRLIAVLLALTGLSFIPVKLSYGHQRDVLRPPELVFAHHWLNPNVTPAPADEQRAVAQLREAVDPSGKSRWLDPRFPLVRRAPGGAESGRDTTTAPDIFIFTVESLRGADVGYVAGNYPPDSSPTPRLDRLARTGVVFPAYISNGNPSPRGFFAINTGVWDHRETFNVSRSPATQFDALPLRLRRAGYFALALWGANPSFDNQLFWAKKWYDRIRYPEPAGRFMIMRPLADDIVMDRLIEEVTAHDQAHPEQPIFAYVASGSTHEPYTIEGRTRLADSAVRAIASERDIRRRYRMVLRNLDAQIGRVLDVLDARPANRPRVIIVVGDHSDAAGDAIPPEMRGLPNNAVEWTAALIAGTPSLIGPPRVERFAASHVDLTPTLLRLAGDRGPTVSMGTDLLAHIRSGDRTALSISGHGYRLDRDGWSLFVRREQPDEVFTKPALAPVAAIHAGVSGSPFSLDDARHLWENMNSWSYLLEQNRVWRPELLDGAPRSVILPAARRAP